MQALKEALAARERAQNRLSALEELRKRQSMGEAQYEQMRTQHLTDLNAAMADLQGARDRLGRQLAAQHEELAKATKRLQDLDLRARLEGRPASEVERERQELTRQVAQLEAEVQWLTTALAAESPEAVPIAEARPVGAPYRPAATTGPSGGQLPPALDPVINFLKRIPTPQGLRADTARYLAAGAGGFLALVVVAIPFASALFISVRLVQTGVGVFCLLVGLAIAGLYFLPDVRVRALSQTAGGALLLLLWIIWLLSGFGFGGLGGWSAGFYLFLIGAVAVILGAVAQLK